ncbi:hypothetical protein PFFCH_00969 [Plasmodium falciparum FCH/4]|uniref:Uncharacterized protein n=1 Tax=Plasmodium falciparum FCH/4 TaxID=1036724 RepID=A0A024VTP7_PLAFA|nr:hypothetical protein PFFCH_00969 [Plasmodium falciparum FCH/4]
MNEKMRMMTKMIKTNYKIQILKTSHTKAEEEATVDLENAEIENLLDEEIYRIVQERLKKLWLDKNTRYY